MSLESRSRLDTALRVLGVIALAEAIILMTAALVVGVLLLIFVDNARWSEPPRGNLSGDSSLRKPAFPTASPVERLEPIPYPKPGN